MPVSSALSIGSLETRAHTKWVYLLLRSEPIRAPDRTPALASARTLRCLHVCYAGSWGSSDASNGPEIDLVKTGELEGGYYCKCNPVYSQLEDMVRRYPDQWNWLGFNQNGRIPRYQIGTSQPPPAHRAVCLPKFAPLLPVSSCWPVGVNHAEPVADEKQKGNSHKPPSPAWRLSGQKCLHTIIY